MTKVRVAINGFGRIGRNIVRAIYESGRKDIDVVAVNDLGPVETNAHLLRFDSVHGRFPHEVKVKGDSINVGTRQVQGHRDQGSGAAAVEGARRRHRARMHRHLHRARQGCGASDRRRQARHRLGPRGRRRLHRGLRHQPRQAHQGAHRDLERVLHHQLPRAAGRRCMHEAVGIEKGMMTTIHSYTGDQPTLDTMHKDLYRARAAALSQIPTSTGAAKAIGLVLPELKGKLDGISIRVPTPNVSVVDLKFVAKRKTTVQEVNEALIAASDGQLKGILAVTRHPQRVDRLQPRSAFLDRRARPDQGDGRRFRAACSSWYDNEWGFSNRMGDTAVAFGKLIA